MYYDNKSTFYMKQYGPAIVVGVASIMLIGSGLYIYFKTSVNPLNRNTEIAKEQTIKSNEIINEEKKEEVKQEIIETKTEFKEEPKVENTTSALKEETKPSSNISNYFQNMKSLEKSKEVTVKTVKYSGYITVETDNETLEFLLIGIDLKRLNNDIVDKIKNDLLNKKVKIAFDVQKQVDGSNYVYLFENNKLYNAELLKSGLLTLRTERQNISLIQELAKAQAYARDNSLGVWK
jgi:hypothetical protein